MTDEELIARLRKDDTDFWHAEAADRIEALVKERDEFAAKLAGDRLGQWIEQGMPAVTPPAPDAAARRDAEEAEAYAAELEANGLANRVAIMRLEARAERLEEALIWCSGSADFTEGGVAREGWLKVCAPLLTGGKDE